MSPKPARDEREGKEWRGWDRIDVFTRRGATISAMAAGGGMIGGIFGLRGAIVGAIFAVIFGIVDASQHPERY
jgi:hypothetical protein